ncbi:MAG: hypothetical protein CL677_10255 [Bdellovibrionaceae bacterium]|nr:hypothetical protein [Pseudobdellovibrionaceae bacterium]|tara:strand:+ start:168194 stop:168787 length:594 start_codon:yes stop_codon:yes gene_type:complete
MAKPGWISLNEYAAKHNVSVSTLRRRIKKSNLLTEMVHGKYWVKDVPLEDHDHPSDMQALNTQAPANELRTEPDQDGLESLSQASQYTESRPPTPFSDSEEILGLTQDLLRELKSAYMQVLQEKEEQILILKSEIDDLQTLVSALESDNKRLREEVEQEKTTKARKEMSKMTFIERPPAPQEDPPFMASSESWLEID